MNKKFKVGDLVVINQKLINHYVHVWHRNPDEYKTLEIFRVSKYIPGSKRMELESFEGASYMNSSDIEDYRKATEGEIRMHKLKKMF
jgi:hypothetical protein